MLLSQLPMISGLGLGNPLRSTYEAKPIIDEIMYSSLQGSHWATMVLKELRAVSAGSLLPFRGRFRSENGGFVRHWLVFPGMRMSLDRYNSGSYVLSNIVFSKGSSVEAYREAFKDHRSEAVSKKSASSLSVKGKKFLKSIERLRLTPYDDQTGKTVDKWVEGATIGYGHLINKAEWSLFKDGITSTQADTLFEGDFEPFVKAVLKYVDTPLNQHQFDALVILAFNIGAGNLKNSSVVSLINDPEKKTPYETLESAWKAWRKSQGKVNQGLINRREAEWKIYEKGVYQLW